MTKTKSGERKIKVWVSRNNRGNPQQLRSYFLNASPRLLTVWTGRSQPNEDSILCTLTIPAIPAKAKRK